MQRFAADIRIETLRCIGNFGSGHVGGAMSIADVLAALYGGVMKINPARPDWEERDWLVISKGHSGPVLYAALALKGYFDKGMLATLNLPNTRLPSHCDRQKTPGVDMTTGSLGQGISTALGVAIGHKWRDRSNRVYCIIGDGEMQEGQIWEAAQCAAHNKVDNFTLVVDYNKRQLDGAVADVNDVRDIAKKFEAFGFDARTVKGYDVRSVYDGLMGAKEVRGKPTLVVLDTYKGIGCDFAEQQPMNHFMVTSREQVEHAVAEIERRLAAGVFPGGESRC